MRAVAISALAFVALAAAGCASSTGGPGSSSGATSPATTSSSPSSSSSAPPTSAPPSTPSNSAPTSAPTTPGCATSQLRVQAVRESGASQMQFARLQFTNTAKTACTLTGYPGVSLYLSGKPLGAPAQRSGTAYQAVTLAPGKAATAKLTDYSSCNAPMSDTVRIYPPNQKAYVDLALKLRGCRLVIDPVVPA